MLSTIQHAERATFAWQRLALFAVAALACSAAFHAHPVSRLWLPAALAAVALAIWHGAYDTVLAEGRLRPRLGPAWKLPFYAAYLALAGVVLLAWWIAPVSALVAFLLYSALHFGTEAEPARSARTLAGATALGFVPVAAASHWWAHRVAAILAVMLHGQAEPAAHITAVSARLLLPAVVVALVCGSLRGAALLHRAALLGTELLLFWLCPPVLAFAVFFCLWHTPEHLVETCRGRGGLLDPRVLRHNLRQGLVPWLLSLAGIGLAAWLARPEAEAYTSVVFIALSALTVPHMVLTLLPATPSRPARLLQPFSRKSLANR